MADRCCSTDQGTCASGKDAAEAVASSGAACCSGGVPVFDGLDPRYKRILWTVIAINAVMFVTEMIAGQLAGSQALQADALDFLGDTVTYGLSLAVIGASLRTRASAALFKGVSLSLMGFWVFGSTLYQTLVLGLPSAEIMGLIGVLALAANVASVGLLLPYKDGDANVRSVWLCSRNDAIGNIAVMIAALAVWGSTTAWPDLAVAAFMAGMFLNSAVQILRQAWDEYRSDDEELIGAKPPSARWLAVTCGSSTILIVSKVTELKHLAPTAWSEVIIDPAAGEFELRAKEMAERLRIVPLYW